MLGVTFFAVIGLTLLFTPGGFFAAGLFGIIALGIFAWVYYLRRRIDITSTIMTISCEVLDQNYQLVGYAGALKIGYFIYVCLMMYLIVCTITGGFYYVPIKDSVTDEIVGCRAEYPSSTVAYMALVMTWTHLWFGEVLTYTVAGTTATWYFHQGENPVALTGGDSDIPWYFFKMSISKSLGSNAMGAAVCTFAEMLNLLSSPWLKKKENSLTLSPSYSTPTQPPQSCKETFLRDRHGERFRIIKINKFKNKK